MKSLNNWMNPDAWDRAGIHYFFKLKLEEPEWWKSLPPFHRASVQFLFYLDTLRSTANALGIHVASERDIETFARDLVTAIEAYCQKESAASRANPLEDSADLATAIRYFREYLFLLAPTTRGAVVFAVEDTIGVLEEFNKVLQQNQNA